MAACAPTSTTRTRIRCTCSRSPRSLHFILDASEHALLRVHADTFEVLGASIEDFEERFLPLHPEFREGWEQVIKPYLANDRQASTEEIAQFNLALMHRILDWLRESERTLPKGAPGRAPEPYTSSRVAA